AVKMRFGKVRMLFPAAHALLDDEVLSWAPAHIAHLEPVSGNLEVAAAPETDLRPQLVRLREPLPPEIGGLDEMEIGVDDPEALLHCSAPRAWRTTDPNPGSSGA